MNQKKSHPSVLRKTQITNIYQIANNKEWLTTADIQFNKVLKKSKLLHFKFDKKEKKNLILTKFQHFKVSYGKKMDCMMHILLIGWAIWTRTRHYMRVWQQFNSWKSRTRLGGNMKINYLINISFCIFLFMFSIFYVYIN